MKKFPIHLPNGATVCTPDNIAVKARMIRCKRVLRANVKSHKEYLKMARQASTKRLSFKEMAIDIIKGAVIGLVFFVSPFVITAYL